MSKLPLQWVCNECIQEKSILGHTINVWWHSDEAYYPGVIDAFDKSSGRHRVQYFDGEWEFVDLRIEPNLISYPANDSLDIYDSAPSKKVKPSPSKSNEKTNKNNSVTVSSSQKKITLFMSKPSNEVKSLALDDNKKRKSISSITLEEESESSRFSRRSRPSK